MTNQKVETLKTTHDMKKTYMTPAATIVELAADAALLQASPVSVSIDNNENDKADAASSLTHRKGWDSSNWTDED